jgi:high-affinity Fe2+/Pb2+ permease
VSELTTGYKAIAIAAAAVAIISAVFFGLSLAGNASLVGTGVLMLVLAVVLLLVAIVLKRRTEK